MNPLLAALRSAFRKRVVPAAAVPVGRPPDADDARRLGRYVLERELGRGSMGAVWLGRIAAGEESASSGGFAGDGVPVAIKTLALAREFGGADLSEARERFFREAEVAGRLTHPDIVRILDVGEDRGTAYLAMEWLRGEDLSRHTLPGELLPVAVVLRTLARVAEALAHAHTQGVVHRDIKPANVMLDLAGGSVKVTDFGIAHVADACRTRTGLVLGTPSFMAPEQLTGGRIDGRSDLYALGVVLYQLLTGSLPHASDSMAELMRAIVNAPAPDVRETRPELPAAVAAIVAQALEKAPERRYADGRRMAEDLRLAADALGEGEPPSRFEPRATTDPKPGASDAESRT